MSARLRRLALPLVLASSLGVFGTAVANIHATADRLELAVRPASVAPVQAGGDGRDVSPRPWECDEPDAVRSAPERSSSPKRRS
jgi:hypothetical protein